MPRNTAGNYTLPLPPVVAGDTVESVWANSTLDDVGTALTDSLDRHGRGGMLAPFLFFDGSEDAPGAAFANQPGTGMWRGASFLAFSVGGVAQLSIDSTGVTVAPASEFYQVLPPGSPQSLTNKAYVDATVGAITDDYLPIGGGTLGGSLTVNGGINASGGISTAAALVGATLNTSGAITSGGNIFAMGRDIIANNNGRVYSSSALGSASIQAPVPGALFAGMIGGYAPHSLGLYQDSTGAMHLNVNGIDVFGSSSSGLPSVRGIPLKHVQCGNAVTDGAGDCTVTFPFSFGGQPSFTAVLVSLVDGFIVLSSIGTSSVTLRAIDRSSGGGIPSVLFSWIAAGPY